MKAAARRIQAACILLCCAAAACRAPDGTVPDLKGMVPIPAGEFWMGSDEGRPDERPAHRVRLDAFYLDEREVTVAQYRAFARSTGRKTPDLPSWSEDGHPAVRVDWNDARDYCMHIGKRLPTEAEWERAARGGLEGKDYPWGNDTPACRKGVLSGARFDDDRDCDDIGTAPVGSYETNGYGLYDMAGNAAEWVADRYDETYYRGSPPEDPRGPGKGRLRVFRGGSWVHDAAHCRVWARGASSEANWDHYLGFRCAYSAGRDWRAREPGRAAPPPGIDDLSADSLVDDFDRAFRDRGARSTLPLFTDYCVCAALRAGDEAACGRLDRNMPGDGYAPCKVQFHEAMLLMHLGDDALALRHCTAVALHSGEAERGGEEECRRIIPLLRKGDPDEICRALEKAGIYDDQSRNDCLAKMLPLTGREDACGRVEDLLLRRSCRHRAAFLSALRSGSKAAAADTPYAPLLDPETDACRRLERYALQAYVDAVRDAGGSR